MIEAVRYTTAPAPLVRRSRKTEKPCPCCNQPGGFCGPHRERLAAIRESLNGKGRYHEKVEQRGYRPPKCCAPQCENRRPRGERYCVECLDAGWEEPE